MPSILAYFKNPDTARKVKALLSEQGVETMQIDRISIVPSEQDSDFNNPISNQSTSIAALTQTGGQGLSGDAGVLLASSTASSGYGGEQVTSRNYLLTVVASQDKLSIAEKIIKENDGLI